MVGGGKDREEMSKAVLVMDMPKDCLHCNLRKVIHTNEKKYQHCGLDTNGYCLESFFKENDLVEGFKSEHCPLREFPKKKNSMNLNSIMEKCKDRDSIMDSILKQFIVDGYNACIDELLKGEEG